MRLGAIHFWVAGALLLVLTVVSIIVFTPVDTERVILPPYEGAFGFRGGRLTVLDYRGETLDEFAWALRRSECGETTSVSVVQATAWADQRVRRVTVPARPRSGAAGCAE
jgi:hypothetical protein